MFVCNWLICKNFSLKWLKLLLSISRLILGCRLWKLRTCGAYCLYFPFQRLNIDLDEKKFLADFPIVVGGFPIAGDQKWTDWPIPTALGKILKYFTQLAYIGPRMKSFSVRVKLYIYIGYVFGSCITYLVCWKLKMPYVKLVFEK